MNFLNKNIMRKLIEKKQKELVKCDNLKCNYFVPYSDDNEKDLLSYIDVLCPKCGKNLLTKEDYLQYQKIMKIVDFINYYFSWITFFYSKKQLDEKKTVHVHVHNGVNIT